MSIDSGFRALGGHTELEANELLVVNEFAAMETCYALGQRISPVQVAAIKKYMQKLPADRQEKWTAELARIEVVI
jgi:hypothetical protein